MAEELDKWSFTSRYRRKNYNWKGWFNGKPWRLTRGTPEERLQGDADFSIDIRNFQSMAIHNAEKKGLELWTEIVDENTIVVQALRRKEE